LSKFALAALMRRRSARARYGCDIHKDAPKIDQNKRIVVVTSPAT